ncbi:hypothetical protein HON22_03630 [Candidatus Peregrinibacteria bacterium]|jgi:hypothetical protein|nr:hypothetical protein [Candidatus Peregrinibacteria bacterium]
MKNYHRSKAESEYEELASLLEENDGPNVDQLLSELDTLMDEVSQTVTKITPSGSGDNKISH